MAKFKSYGRVFEVTDRYGDGHAINAKEAEALNTLMGEFLSHKLRAKFFSDLVKGQTASDELVTTAQTWLNENTASFQFGTSRGTGERAPRIVDPIEQEARHIATNEVKAAMAARKMKLAKKGAEAGEGELSFEKYQKLIAATAAKEAVLKKAKRVVAARLGKAEDAPVDVDLDLAA